MFTSIALLLDLTDLLGSQSEELTICSEAGPSAVSNQSLIDFPVLHSFKDLTKLIRFLVAAVTTCDLVEHFLKSLFYSTKPPLPTLLSS